MDENKQVVARVQFKGHSIEALEKAFRELIIQCRCRHEAWQGMGSTDFGDADDMPAHSFELIEETLTDKSKVLNVRMLFVGDV